MARKFGKKNVIKIDPLAYNVGLFGQSGVGKTTLAVEYCEKLAGEDGYILLNIGREDGVDAIPDAIYENIPDWETFEEFVDDVVENRNTDYKDLKIVVFDTLDELFRIVEPEVIRLHNKQHPEKKVTSIKAAFGGYQAGEDKAVDLVIEKIWELKDVGVNFLVVGHTKRRSQTDVVTGEEYETLTAKMASKYFESIKTKLHVLGVASIDRSIEKQRVKQKIGNDKIVGKITGESRIITFRDDNFNIDSKSRFTEIIPEIELDVEQFIEAINDAIKKAHDKQKNKKSLSETKKEQKVAKEQEIKKAVEANKRNRVNSEENEELADVIKSKFTKATDEQKVQIKTIMDEYGFSNFKDTDTIPTEALRKIVDLLA
ncbi:AAA family ATPase [Robertmurraya siralis]|uniref:AAA family ATPase n=1 Tax=Robertmurraya siralis TaxID=77777 RepID=UPI0010F7F83B|nr:AAA family ATPase [Robertmurraya siralis]